MKCPKCGSDRLEKCDEEDYVLVRCLNCGHVVVNRRVGSKGPTTETLGIALAAAVTATAIASALV